MAYLYLMMNSSSPRADVPPVQNNGDLLEESTGGTNESSEEEKPRLDYLSWPDYFMAVAYLSSQRSKDPSTQVIQYILEVIRLFVLGVGACIVSEDNKIVGIGYNGMPIGCADDKMPWGKYASNKLDTKYPYVCHAEMNAIMNKNSSDVKGCTIYVTLFPCSECAKLIIQAGIKRIIYKTEKPDRSEASKRMFDMVGITYSIFEPKTTEPIVIRL